ncbi:bifunctional 2',3'-cyclic-nucleotide 2'-phosphodiesterase/3'-nucleotidase [Alishewanella sp. d11]|uniref:bifunctional 2',3'-cyclic-nucleotide 2'-phosphodiesterase/3'-nucleotidase n=1 Tax=Alishewanella sp. d11 TaxID=3414030 RepID=UPI003BF7B097
MRLLKLSRSRLSILCLAIVTGLTACSKASDESIITVQLRVLETSDLHANIMDYNYYTDTTDATMGLARTASLIAKARAEVKNTVLVDNGDLIQGGPLGDYVAYKGLADGEVHPLMQAMNTLNYAAATLGNHEFNFGLDFLYRTVAGANFPYTIANVFCAVDNCRAGVKQGETLYPPYLIKATEVLDEAGQRHTLNIGYIGFVPPQIMQWDKQHLAGQVTVASILETAQQRIPQMKAEGADVVIVLSHSGLGQVTDSPDPQAEHLAYALTRVPGVNAVLSGHSHSVFPHARYQDLPNTDLQRGLINGIPTVLPGRWGDHLGVVDFTLQRKGNAWQVQQATAKVLPVFDNQQNQSLVAADPKIVAAIAEGHQGTMAFMQRTIGVAATDMYSFLAQVQDDPTVQIVADAQRARLAAILPPELQHYPILSAAAPFKAGGGRRNSSDANQYVQVPKGELSFRNAADLYLFPNTLVAVKASGAEVKDWLECSANQFNQIDLTSSAPQQLINTQHQTYNFDVIDGVRYQIDVSQPAKFNQRCELVNANASRIVNLSYTDAEGKTYTGDDFAALQFIVATNNYRAYTGLFAGTGSDKVVLEAPDTNREALVQFISQQSQYDAATERYLAAVNPAADHNWQLLPLQSAVALDIRLQTQDSSIAEHFVKTQQFWPMTKLASLATGFADYRINLQQP